ncbi:pentapeptide repeat-containing protein [Nonomuraea sp. NPDC005650]|uniref:pentapeptide repeat-containing protein n=1 Tax=Nonomuraea sp. NPDC005650 TaxID=3157045 RepID=UPI0033A50840
MGWIILTVLAVGAAAGITAWWLSSGLPPLKPAQEATARIDVIRTALAAGAGVGAAITLMLAFRRQRHHEIVAASTEHDASERRVTELYTKAAEQLGNAQAPVRLAGLYALERLAQNNPDQRQTIVNVICAYLRMPYTPPSEDRHDKIRTAQRIARHGAWARASAAAGDRDAQEERQVRLTAQRILTDHLHYTKAPASGRGQRRISDLNARFWRDIRLDLTGATLLDFDLADCRVSSAEFHKTAFTGFTTFGGAIFTDTVWFSEATFIDVPRFSGATFDDTVWFDRTTFDNGSRFDRTTFSGTAWFDRATFTGATSFGGATFTDTAAFGGATFTDTVWFGGATFAGNAWFGGTTTIDAAASGEADFTDAATFDMLDFVENAALVRVRGAEYVELEGARVARPDAGHVWPPGWRLVAEPDGEAVLRREPSAPPGYAQSSPHGTGADATDVS